MSGVSAVDYGALADELDISDITSDEVNANILRQIKDEGLAYLRVSDKRIYFDGQEYVLENARGAGVLGYYLGRSTAIAIELGIGLSEDVNTDMIAPFLAGLQSNRSIRSLSIAQSHIPGDFFRMLTPFIRDNTNLVLFDVYSCRMDAEQYRSVSSALGEIKSLRNFRIDGLVEGRRYDPRQRRFDGRRYDHEEPLVDCIEALKIHPRLTEIHFQYFTFGRTACGAISDLLRQSDGMQTLSLRDDCIDDSGVEALVEGLTHCRGLSSLDLSENPSITAKGWRALSGALSSLLEDPNSALRELLLWGSGIDDASATILANALEDNSSLETLYLHVRTVNSTGEGWAAAFSKVLCNTSSVNSTFLSNHTLQNLTGPGRRGDDLPGDLSSLLDMNQDEDKQAVAARKILLHYDDFDMQPLFEWDLKVLPFVAEWLERAAAYEIESEARMEKRKLSALYQFIRGMPELAMEGIAGRNKKSPKKVGGKRSYSFNWLWGLKYSRRR